MSLPFHKGNINRVAGIKRNSLECQKEEQNRAVI